VTRLGVIFTADRPSEALPAMEIATLARLHPGRVSTTGDPDAYERGYTRSSTERFD
jgi:hypothetical protein